MNDILCFDLNRLEKPVTIQGEGYVLVELDGRSRDKYLTSLAARMKLNKDGKPCGISNFDSLQASLISSCLFKVDALDGTRTPVKAETIQGWRSSVIKSLFEESRKLSGLDESDDDIEGEEKND